MPHRHVEQLGVLLVVCGFANPNWIVAPAVVLKDLALRSHVVGVHVGCVCINRVRRGLP
jgi:hypothetical protein